MSVGMTMWSLTQTESKPFFSAVWAMTLRFSAEVSSPLLGRVHPNCMAVSSVAVVVGDGEIISQGV